MLESNLNQIRVFLKKDGKQDPKLIEAVDQLLGLVSGMKIIGPKSCRI